MVWMVVRIRTALKGQKENRLSDPLWDRQNIIWTKRLD